MALLKRPPSAAPAVHRPRQGPGSVPERPPVFLVSVACAALCLFAYPTLASGGLADDAAMAPPAGSGGVSAVRAAGDSIQAASQAAPEYALKAELLYRLADFIVWPRAAQASETEPFIVAVFGSDPFGPLLEAALRERTTRGRSFAVRRIASVEELVGAPPDLLFVPGVARDVYDDLLRWLADKPILTVGEDREFIDAGGMIAMRMRGGRPRIEIALERAGAAGFGFDSRLLGLAEIVSEEDLRW